MENHHFFRVNWINVLAGFPGLVEFPLGKYT